MHRRSFVLGAGAAALSSCFRLARPPPLEGPLSDNARGLLWRAWAGLDANQVLDVHVHLVGLGAGGTGCWVNPALRQPFAHPVNAVRFDIYTRAGGVTDPERGDRQYVEALVARIRGQLVHGRALLLAFDQTYSPEGQPQPELTEFYTPNDYVLKVAREFPDCFVPAASVHPYRRDAVEALERAVEGGAVAVKWLPNAMRIDPASARCDAFYAALARLKVPLLTHAGEEKAVEADEAQRFGNPLLLRRPLEAGVRVIIAHCAGLGQNPDLDAPGKPWVDNFDLFTRMMDDARWKGSLWGDVSAMPQVNRAGRPLVEVLKRTEWHSRLINGSDYPLPAITTLIQTRALVERGFLTATERLALNELDQHNPLLFDFVLKRTLAVRDATGVHRFSPEVFTARDVFPRLRPPA